MYYGCIEGVYSVCQEYIICTLKICLRFDIMVLLKYKY